MIVEVFDMTAAFLAGAGNLVLETGSSKFITIQFVGFSGTVTFQGSNNGGGTAGSTNNSPTTATDFVTIGGYNLSAPLTVVTTAAAAGLYRIDSQCRYIKFSSSGATSTKVFVFFSKSL